MGDKVYLMMHNVIARALVFEVLECPLPFDCSIATHVYGEMCLLLHCVLPLPSLCPCFSLCR